MCINGDSTIYYQIWNFIVDFVTLDTSSLNIEYIDGKIMSILEHFTDKNKSQNTTNISAIRESLNILYPEFYLPFHLTFPFL